MVSELILISAMNYIQATNGAVSAKEASTLVTAISNHVSDEQDFFYFLAMAEVESRFDINAVNKTSGAYGALQVMPMHFKGKKPSPIVAIQKGIEQYYYWKKGCSISWGRNDIYCAARYYNGGYKAHRTKQTLTYATKIDKLYNMHMSGWVK